MAGKDVSPPSSRTRRRLRRLAIGGACRPGIVRRPRLPGGAADRAPRRAEAARGAAGPQGHDRPHPASTRSRCRWRSRTSAIYEADQVDAVLRVLAPLRERRSSPRCSGARRCSRRSRSTRCACTSCARRRPPTPGPTSAPPTTSRTSSRAWRRGQVAGAAGAARRAAAALLAQQHPRRRRRDHLRRSARPADHHEVTSSPIGVPFVSTLPVYLDSFVEPGLSVRDRRHAVRDQGAHQAVQGFARDRARAAAASAGSDPLPAVRTGAPAVRGGRRRALSLALDVDFVRPRADAPRLTIKGDVGARRSSTSRRRTRLGRSRCSRSRSWRCSVGETAI